MEVDELTTRQQQIVVYAYTSEDNLMLKSRPLTDQDFPVQELCTEKYTVVYNCSLCYSWVGKVGEL